MKIFEILACLGQILSNSLFQFWNEESIPLQILHPFSVSWKIFRMYFLSSKNIYFAKKEPIKMKILEILECSGQILSNSLCQFWNDKLLPLQILYLSPVSWKVIPLYFFRSKNIYLAQKEPIKMKIFEIFECLCQSLWNSLCQFWNEESIPLKFCIPLQFHERLLLCIYFFS